MSTIQGRLMRRLVIGWGLLLLLGGGIAYLTTRAALTRQFDQSLRVKALALSSLIEQDHGRIDLDFGDLRREFDSEISGAFFQVWGGAGDEVARSASLREEKLPLRHGTLAAPVFWDLACGKIPARAIGVKFQPHLKSDEKKEEQPREAILVVAADRRELNQALGMVGLLLAGSGMLVLAATAAGLPWLVRGELAPLNDLAERTEAITAESLGARFPVTGLPGELAPISRRLNDLLQRLQNSFERERQFSDDLAHEFRTPIAELRSLAEIALKWPEGRPGNTDQEVLAIARQMEGMINRLLAITRSEPGQMAVEKQKVELGRLVAAVCQPLEGRATARKLTIQTKVSPTLGIQSDPVLLRGIVANLIENAVEYSTPGGTVRVESETQNGEFKLRVTNQAGELKTEDVPHLFERFWRKDAARSGGDHSGLGLPLARAFALSLGYTLTAALDQGTDLTMTLAGSTHESISTNTKTKTA